MRHQTHPGADSDFPLMKEMEITRDRLDRRKAFLEFDAEDIRQLVELNQFAPAFAQDFIESFYAHLLSFEEARAFFKDPTLLDRVKLAQTEYFGRLTQGLYDDAYCEDRLNVGAVHEHIGLPIDLYLGMYNFYLRNVGLRIFDAYPGQPEKALGAYFSLMKLVFLDIGLAIDTYLARREQVIRKQAEAYRELPTPVLQVWEGLLILPLVGVLESYRARQLTEQLLNSIRDTRAKVAILDITGVPVVDSKVANHLLQTVSAARLMGATILLTGLSPQIAQALVAIGVDLSQIRTLSDLQGGLEEAARLLGYRLTPIQDQADRAPNR